MKRPQKGSTPKQYAYAARKLSGQGQSKQEIALLSGFSPSVAKNAKNKIENTEGYQNAVVELATRSNNLAIAIMAEYQARGLSNFSNKDLNGAMNAIAQAWQKFDKKMEEPKNKNPEINPLRRVILQKVENQTLNVQASDLNKERTIDVEPLPTEGQPLETPPAPKPEPAGLGLDLDF